MNEPVRDERAEGTFPIKAAALAKFETVSKQIDDAAFLFANEFIDAGQLPAEAGSVVANILIASAWKIAATGRIADGEQPRADRFREAVEAVLSRYVFDVPGTPANADDMGSA